MLFSFTRTFEMVGNIGLTQTMFLSLRYIGAPHFFDWALRVFPYPSCVTSKLKAVRRILPDERLYYSTIMIYTLNEYYARNYNLKYNFLMNKNCVYCMTSSIFGIWKMVILFEQQIVLVICNENISNCNQLLLKIWPTFYRLRYQNLIWFTKNVRRERIRDAFLLICSHISWLRKWKIFKFLIYVPHMLNHSKHHHVLTLLSATWLVLLNIVKPIHQQNVKIWNVEQNVEYNIV